MSALAGILFKILKRAEKGGLFPGISNRPLSFTLQIAPEETMPEYTFSSDQLNIEAGSHYHQPAVDRLNSPIVFFYVDKNHRLKDQTTGEK
jgi:hypothetical protein